MILSEKIADTEPILCCATCKYIWETSIHQEECGTTVTIWRRMIKWRCFLEWNKSISHFRKLSTDKNGSRNWPKDAKWTVSCITAQLESIVDLDENLPKNI